MGLVSGQAGLAEPLFAFFGATALASILYWTGMLVPFVRENLHGAIAFIFLFTPSLAARLSKRPFDYDAAGMRLDPLGLNARVLGVALLVSWPLFVVAFLAFYGAVCGIAHAPGSFFLTRWFDWLTPHCGRWQGWRGARLTLPHDFVLLAISQVIVVAIPEELFFRGYLMGRLEERWPSSRRLLGAPVGRALVVSSALFAIGHVLVDFNPERLAVFFPALLFGWMRSRTGSIAAGALFHALCNLFSDFLHISFFP